MSESHISPFDAIRRVSEHGNEYWSARELSKILTYDDYRNFQKVMSKAIKSCESAGEEASDHFVEVTDMIAVGKGAKRPRNASADHLPVYRSKPRHVETSPIEPYRPTRMSADPNVHAAHNDQGKKRAEYSQRICPLADGDYDPGG